MQYEAEKTLKIAALVIEGAFLVVREGNPSKFIEALSVLVSKDVTSEIRRELIDRHIRDGDAYIGEAARQVKHRGSLPMILDTIDRARNRYVAALGDPQLSMREQGLVHLKIGACYLSRNEKGLARDHWERAYEHLLLSNGRAPDHGTLPLESRQLAERAASEKPRWRRGQAAIDISDLALQLTKLGSDLPDRMLGIGSAQVSQVMNSLQAVLGGPIDLSGYGRRHSMADIRREDGVCSRVLVIPLRDALRAARGVAPRNDMGRLVSTVARDPGLISAWSQVDEQVRAFSLVDHLMRCDKDNATPHYGLSADLLAQASSERRQRERAGIARTDDPDYRSPLNRHSGPTRLCVEEVLFHLPESWQLLLMADLAVAWEFRPRTSNYDPIC
ncbi:hypothetical protein [Streptosporangium roseum]|uniref:hypothetical protein n=1 Tax=Streptosporangium roseum TaxID=2001 RepID=UPI0012DE7FC9|nr:hypothetical protein [Streptosporangium roseum]